MKTICIPVTLIDEKVYIYYDENSLEGVVIDPGSDEELIIKAIKKNNITIKGILLTHGHFDHISAASAIKKYTNSKIVANKHEAVVLNNPKINLSRVGMHKDIIIEADIYLDDNEKFQFADTDLTLIHTPGHTPGGACFYSKENAILFSGDTIFYETMGRTDLPLGDESAILHSIREKLLVLPDDIVVYPGHGANTTIGHEKKHNPCISEGEF